MLGIRKYLLVMMTLVTLLVFFVSQVSAAVVEETQESNPVNDNSLPIDTTALSAILYEPLTGTIVYEKEPHRRLPMASVTKLMTLLLAAEEVEKGKFRLTDRVVTSENAWEMGGSQIYLEIGEEMTLWEMLTAVGLQSANDASVAIAEHIAGSEENFVRLMNEKSRTLGLQNTNFVNCHGLTADDHYTSAHDLAVIMREGLKNEVFKKISSMKEYDLRGGAFKLWNTNKLLWWYEGADAGKTGWTEAAKYCLASTAERDGLRLICVVMGTEETGSHFKESIKIYNNGFASYKSINYAQHGASIGYVRVGKGKQQQVEAIASEKVSVVARRGKEEGYVPVINLIDFIDAPVKKGQKVGTYIIEKDGKIKLEVALVAGENVPKASMIEQMRKVVNEVY